MSKINLVTGANGHLGNNDMFVDARNAAGMIAAAVNGRSPSSHLLDGKTLNIANA